MNDLSRRGFLRRLSAATAVLAAGTWCGRAAEKRRRPNVLFILADDLGWRDTSFTGSTFYETPNVERLAQRGMFFPNAYSASPLCSPTRASILTGLNPARVGITAPNCHLPEEVFEPKVAEKAPATVKTLGCSSVSRLKHEYVTLAETLKAAGYATGHFGKWHLGRDPYDPLHQGFDVDIPHWPGPGPAGSFVAPWRFPDFKERTPKEHIEDRMGDEAVAFLEAHKDEPFLLNYWQFSVHAPFDAKAELIERYKTKVDPNNPQKSPTYAAMVHSLDDNVGKMLDALDRLGLAEDTIVIFFSDNGGNMYNTVDGTTPTSNAPLRGGKATMYEGGIRVPCIIRWPGVTPPASRSEAIIQSVDFYPTLLEMLDIPVPAGLSFDGISITPALRGGSLDREAIFTFFPHNPKVPEWLPPSVCVRKGDWKLIRIFHDGEAQAHRYELYNLRDDIGERTDLSAREPARVKELDSLIERFLRDTAAVVPLPNPAYRADARDSVGGWKEGPNGHAVLSDRNGLLEIVSTGGDPMILSADPLSYAPGDYRLLMRMRAKASGGGQVFCTGPDKRVRPGTGAGFAVLHDGEWHDYDIKLNSEQGVHLLRIDPCSGEGDLAIEWIRLRNAEGGTVREWAFAVKK